MDAVTNITRPLAQVLLPPSGTAPASRPETPANKSDDAVFVPTEKPVERPADKRTEKRAEPTKAEPANAEATEAANTTTETKTSSSEKPSTPGDKPAVKKSGAGQSATDPVAAAAPATANADAMLIAQTVQPTQQIVATPPVITLPGSASPVAAATTAAIPAIAGQTRQAAQPSAPAPTPSASDADPTAQQPDAKGAAAVQATPPLQTQAQTPASSQTVNTDASGSQPNALNALLDGAKPQGAAQPAATLSTAQQPATATAAQTIAQPSAQPVAPQTVAPAAQPQTDVALPATEANDKDAAIKAPTTVDASNAPAISFGTDPGATAQVKTATAAYETARTAVPIVPASEQVAMEIHRAVKDGVDKLTVDLKPASLGRVTAEIQFQNDHRIHVVLSADRPATLDALRSDSRALERALQDAGLQADAGSLSFRFQNGGGQSGFMPDNAQAEFAAPQASPITDIIANIAPYAATMRPGGVDIRV